MLLVASSSGCLGRPYRPNTSPLNHDIIDDGVEASPNPVRLVLWKDDLPSIAAFMKRIQDIRDVIFLIAVCFDDAHV